jgi:conjugative relaxase-like TrwC/TraI family protein
MIHPRRLKGTPANIARYYTVGDYYTKGADEHSEWGGAIAADLELRGAVDPTTFKAMLAGQVGDQQLGRHRANGKIQHHPGWDFAVNAPKSVSIMALVAGDERIVEAHEQAVTTALDYLESHATWRHRQDRGVIYQTTGRLVYARFTEQASRELDPHLHTHVVVMNMTNAHAGAPMASLETRALYAEQMVVGQVYRNDLAHRLRELGYDIDFDPRKGLFEIIGVPKELITDMSRRAKQIEVHAREHGLTGQAARRRSFYETRGPKVKLALEDLHGRWAQRIGTHREAVEATRAAAGDRGEHRLVIDSAVAARAMLFGLRQAEGKEAVNNLGRLLRYGLASSVGDVRLRDIFSLAEIHQTRAKLLETRHPTGDEIHTRGRTSRRTARLELALSDHLALALGDASPLATSERLECVAHALGLNEHQHAALLRIGMTSDRVFGLHGVAGSGKSTLVHALNEAARPGIILIGHAPTSSATSNLGNHAKIEARTVAGLIASGGRNLDERHTLIVDEAGQLGNRQTLRLLEISRLTGARLILLGDHRQTGAIEQGKAFWLMQRLGLPTAELTESVRQQTRGMKEAVAKARLQNYAASIAALDKVATADTPEKLAESLVREWTRLKPENRANTNILVLENTTRLVVNAKIREALRTEGAIAAEEARLSVLTPSGMTAQEKRLARFYSGGQVIVFSRDNAGLGIAGDVEYRVLGLTRDRRGREFVRLVDGQGCTTSWDPRLGRTSQISVFQSDERALATGDRIQWRLVNQDLGIRNADRGSVLALEGTMATIKWDLDGRVQQVDLAEHKNWDHGYAETIYSAQSKTYDRVYVLAPVGSHLVTGQNYYTAITRARFGVKLWTQSVERLVERLEARSGEKTSSLEGLGRLDRSAVRARIAVHRERFGQMREDQRVARRDRKLRLEAARLAQDRPGGLLELVALRARRGAESMDRWLSSLLKTDPPHQPNSKDADWVVPGRITPDQSPAREHGGRHDR